MSLISPDMLGILSRQCWGLLSCHLMEGAWCVGVFPLLHSSRGHAYGPAVLICNIEKIGRVSVLSEASWWAAGRAPSRPGWAPRCWWGTVFISTGREGAIPTSNASWERVSVFTRSAPVPSIFTRSGLKSACLLSVLFNTTGLFHY